MSSDDTLIYESPPPRKIRALAGLSVVVFLFSLLAAHFVFTRMTGNDLPAELAPLAARLALAAVIAVLGGGFFAGMLFYLTVYATRLTRVAGTDRIRVETLGIIGRKVRTLASDQMVRGSYHRGQAKGRHGLSVDAPWFWMSVKDERGFLIDAAGWHLKTDSLAKLLVDDPA